MRSIMDDRVASLKHRRVPLNETVSGITLVVVPPWICATVNTAGSNTSMLRVTMDCSASTVSHAAGIGSLAQWGVDV